MDKFDLADLAHYPEVRKALHGDLRPLVALLRSGKRLSRIVRDYIADEIEREPSKRFRRQRREDLHVKDRDRELLYRVWSAKYEIAMMKLGADVDGCELYGALDSISDRDALDFIMRRYGEEIDPDALTNALRRSPPSGFIDPRGPRRYVRKREM